MEEEGAVGELEEEEEGAVGVVVSDSEEKLEVLRQPGLIQKLATLVTQRASCVIGLEGGTPLTIRPATQRRRPYPPHPQSACSTTPYRPLSTFHLIMPVDRIAPTTITAAVRPDFLNVAARQGLGTRVLVTPLCLE